MGGAVQQIDQGQLLASIAATSHDCILSVDARGTVQWASPATLDVLGWRPEDLAGSELSVIAPRDGGDLYAAYLQRLLDGERVPPFVDNAVRRDGGTFKASVTLGPVQDEGGEVIGVIVILRDVTTELREQRGHGPAEEGSPADADRWPSLYDAPGRGPGDAVVVLDRGLRAAHASPSVRQLLGHDPADVVGTPAREYVHPADDSHAAEVVARLLDEPRHTERLVLRVREREDGWRWIEATLTNCLDDPGIRGLVAHLRDVSERVHTEEALRVSEALHRAMVETAQDGIIAMAPDGSTTFANETVARILGRPLEDLYRGSIARLGLDVGEAGAGPSEITYAHPGGGSRVLEVSCRSLTGDHAEALGSLVTVTDVTEARNAETTLRRKALQDPLTGLPNRYLFLDRLETAVARHLRHVGRGTAVLYLDLDDFKPINDAHGHQVGDEVMHEVGRRLAGAVRATDTVGRLGGDEFAIICEDTDEQAAVLVAAKVLAELCRPIPHGSQEYCIGVSIGVAVTPPHEFTDLVRLADAAMYRAKQLGGSRVAVARRQVTTGPGDVAVS